MSATAAEPLDPALLDHLLDSIVEAIPAGANDTEQTRATRRNAARLALLALKPADAFQAMLAAQAVAAHYAVMDAYRLAAQPDLAPAMTARMRSNAATLSRTMQATLRTLHKHQAPPAEAKAQPSPRSPAQSRPAKPAPRPLLPPLPAPTEPLPRIRLWDEMTMQERRETYGYKGDPKFNPINGGK